MGEIAEAKKLWDEGKSPSLIASILNKKFQQGRDRHDVLRMLKVGARTTRRNGQRLPGAEIPKGTGNLFVGPPEVIKANNRGRRAPQATVEAVYSLDDLQCKWPIGDPLEKGFRFCPSEQEIGHKYCAHHLKRSIRPPDAKEE